MKNLSLLASSKPIPRASSQRHIRTRKLSYIPHEHATATAAEIAIASRPSFSLPSLCPSFSRRHCLLLTSQWLLPPSSARPRRASPTPSPKGSSPSSSPTAPPTRATASAPPRASLASWSSRRVWWGIPSPSRTPPTAARSSSSPSHSSGTTASPRGTLSTSSSATSPLTSSRRKSTLPVSWPPPTPARTSHTSSPTRPSAHGSRSRASRPCTASTPAP